MATMKRNVNLEEIDTDAFMGITFLKYQTIGQKVIFIGSIVVSVVFTILGSFLFHLNQNILILCTLSPLLLGVMFGANYNQDYSLIEYIVLLIKKPVQKYVSHPFEDITHLREIRKSLEEEDKLRNKNNEFTEGFKRKLMLSLVIGAIAMVVIVVVIIVVGKSLSSDDIHHTVAVFSEYYRS